MKKVLSICLAVCIMMSVACSFGITASAMTEIEQPTITVSNGAKAINVKWSKIVGIKSYKVYKKVAGAKKYSVVKTTNGNTSKFVDNKVAAGKTYCYKVSAVKNSKNVVTTATKSIVRLLAPTNLKAKNYSRDSEYASSVDKFRIGNTENNVLINQCDGVELTWNKTKGANKYDIYRKINNGKYKKIKTSDINRYVDEDITITGTNCYYKVVAKKNNSKSVSSNVKKHVYVALPNIDTVPITSGMQIKFSYQEESDGCKIYRSTSGIKGKYTLIAKLGKNKTTYVDKNVSLNKRYCYKVVAYKGSSNSCGSYIQTKYAPFNTVVVKAGKTNDIIKVLLDKMEEYYGDKFGINDYSIPQYIDMLQLTSLDSNIATISDDKVVTGVSAGTTKIKVELKLKTNTVELPFILADVK